VPTESPARSGARYSSHFEPSRLGTALITTTAAPGDVTTDTLDKDAEGASWARALAAALGAGIPDSDSGEQHTG
jgi:hypothetical protein